MNVGMRRKEQGRTVEFGQLSEDHKAEFIQFLIKNNICFQEGKENCTAQVALPSQKQAHHSVKPSQRTPLAPRNSKPVTHTPTIKHKETEARPKKGQLRRPKTPEPKQRQLKTPTKK